jgi:hypothetical protein
VLFTRSLHHVHDLDNGIAAALECLTAGGRVIIEDFDAAWGDPRTEAWFRGIVRTLAASGVAFEDGGWAAGHLSDAPPPENDDHDHDLHGAARIEAACARLGTVRTAEPSAYFFRYFLAATRNAGAIAATVLAQECEAVANQWMAPLGRRLVVERAAGADGTSVPVRGQSLQPPQS